MRDVFAPNGGLLAKRLSDLFAERNGRSSPLFVDAELQQVFMSSPDPVLSVYDHCELLKRVERLSDESDWALSLGGQCDLRDAGLLGYMMRACATLGEACTILGRWSRTFVTQPFDPSDTDRPTATSLTWTYGGQSKLDLRRWSEFTAALLIMNFRTLTGGDVQPSRVEFVHNCDGNKSMSDAVFGVTPRFECSQNRIVFSAQDLHAPLMSKDPGLLRILLDYAELLDVSDPSDINHLSISVERMIMDRLAGGEASLAKIAELLGMSQRTLSRRLTAENTSFFVILERVRKSLAIRYLSTREKPLSEIAYLLGYSSLSSFNDAFRRWTGDSPGSYRTQIMSSQ